MLLKHLTGSAGGQLVENRMAEGSSSDNAVASKKLSVSFRNDEDSDPLPYHIDVTNINDLKHQLLEICCIADIGDRNIVIILEGSEKIISLDKLVDSSLYEVSFKMKPTLVKFYLAKA